MFSLQPSDKDPIHGVVGACWAAYYSAAVFADIFGFLDDAQLTPELLFYILANFDF